MEECIRSIAPGRIRVRHDALKDAELAERVRGFLETKEGVRSASVNPRTGSLLLEYDPEHLAPLHLLAFVEEMQQTLLIDVREKTEEQCGCSLFRPLSGLMGGMTPRQLENRGMMLALGASVACILAGRGTGHAAFGWVFLALNALHLVRYRKCL